MYPVSLNCIFHLQAQYCQQSSHTDMEPCSYMVETLCPWPDEWDAQKMKYSNLTWIQALYGKITWWSKCVLSVFGVNYVMCESVKLCLHTSSSTDWNSLSSGARSISTVPWLEQWNVRYGFAPTNSDMKVSQDSRNQSIDEDADQSCLCFHIMCTCSYYLWT